MDIAGLADGQARDPTAPLTAVIGPISLRDIIGPVPGGSTVLPAAPGFGG